MWYNNYVYFEKIELCDIYLGLYGNLYGYEDAEGVSPTEREYDLAALLHKSRLVYIKSVGEDKRHPKETALIKKVERDIVRKIFVVWTDCVLRCMLLWFDTWKRKSISGGSLLMLHLIMGLRWMI